jgi:integrase
VRRDGRALRAHHVHAARSTARRATELPGVHLHDLRHAGLTLAAQSGATLAEVMRRAGHSSSRAAMIYQHAAERRDAEVAARLGRLAAGTAANHTGT